MPAYPFIAIFLAQYAIYITEYRTKVTRIFAAFLASVTTVVLIAIGLTMIGVIDPVAIASQYTSRTSTLAQVEAVSNIFSFSYGLTVCIVIVVLVALLTVLLPDVQKDKHQDPVCDNRPEFYDQFTDRRGYHAGYPPGWFCPSFCGKGNERISAE